MEAGKSNPIERHQASQTELLKFLHSDIDLARTMLETAAIERNSNLDHCHAAIEKVQSAVRVIRRFQGWIENGESWKTIQSRANALELELDRELEREHDVLHPSL